MAAQLGQVSPDGLYRWDGSRWVPALPATPPGTPPGQISPDGRWWWNGVQWLPNQAPVLRNPPGLVLFRGYCIVIALFFGILGSLGFIGLIANRFDPGAFDTTATTLTITTLVFGFGLLEGVLAFVAVIAPRRPWGWVVGLIVMITGLLGITLIAAIPLLIYWTRAEMRAYYGMRA